MDRVEMKTRAAETFWQKRFWKSRLPSSVQRPDLNNERATKSRQA